MRRARVVVGQARELMHTTRVASRAYGCGRLAAVRRARALRGAGWTYREALTAGLLDPAWTDDELGRLVSAHFREIRQRELDPLSLAGVTEDKLTFARFAEGVGLPVPRTYGTVGRHGGWSAATDRAVPDASAFARMVRGELPEEFVVKPVLGYLGLGVRVLRRDGDALRDTAGVAVTPEGLFAEMAGHPEFGLFMLQERLHNHPDIDALHRSDTLQTIRLTTLITRDGGVMLLFSWLKVGLGEPGSDNFRGGATGNGISDIDCEAGTLGPLHVLRADGLGVTAADPDVTGGRWEGVAAPLFDEARALVFRFAPMFLPVRTLGWDVAITPAGPVVVEVNATWASPLTPLTPEAWEAFQRG